MLRKGAKPQKPDPPKRPKPAPPKADTFERSGIEDTDVGEVEMMSMIESSQYEDPSENERAPKKNRASSTPRFKKKIEKADPDKMPPRQSSSTPRLHKPPKPVPTPKPKAPPMQTPDPEGSGSLLDMMEDVSEAAGMSLKGQFDDAPTSDSGKLDLIVRKDEKKKKPKRITLDSQKEPEPVIVASTEQIMQQILRGRLINRILIRVFPQVILLAAVIFFGFPFVDSFYFQGLWRGEITDTIGRTATFELTLDRHGSEILGQAYFFRPDGETLLTPVKKSKMPAIISEAMSDENGNVEGYSDAEKAEFSVFAKGNTGSSIRFDGTFSDRHHVEGTVKNMWEREGRFTLSRVNIPKVLP
jgi:hypothetical protein